jgi:hypothetical protein
MAPGKGCKDEHEIRVTSSGSEKVYIAYALELLKEESQDSRDDKSEAHACQKSKPKKSTEMAKTAVLWATGNAMTKCVSVCEIIKRQRPGIHQLTQISSIEQHAVGDKP